MMGYENIEYDGIFGAYLNASWQGIRYKELNRPCLINPLLWSNINDTIHCLGNNLLADFGTNANEVLPFG